MKKQYSIAEARQHFAAIVHEVESANRIEITRRGKVVAILLSQKEFQRISDMDGSFWKAYMAFAGENDLTSLDIQPEIFSVRDPHPGRIVNL